MFKISFRYLLDGRQQPKGIYQQKVITQVNHNYGINMLIQYHGYSFAETERMKFENILNARSIVKNR